MTDGHGPEDEGETVREKPTAEASTDISLDTTFDVLASAERRVILTCLSEAPDNVATVTELAQELGTQSTDCTGNGSNPRSAKIQIHHSHLPKLASVGLVEYDIRSEEVRYWPDERLERWLQRTRAEEGV